MGRLREEGRERGKRRCKNSKIEDKGQGRREWAGETEWAGEEGSRRGEGKWRGEGKGEDRTKGVREE